MNGVHDLGGMHGFGPVEREEHEPLFHAAWEARARAAMHLSMGKYFTADAARYGWERIAPAEYLRISFFERWLASFEYNLVEQGLLADGELDTRLDFLRAHPGAEPPRAAVVSPTVRAQEAPAESPPAPRFAVGDAVLARNDHPVGHTRLPRYARGKRGVIQAVRGAQVFADTNAHGLGEHPHVVYNVRFAGRDLWGDAPDAPAVVHLDLWERYLEPAPV